MTSIEKIWGKEYTIINKTGDNLLGRHFIEAEGVFYIFENPNCMKHIATALPPLPRNPKPEDAPLLYRYMAEGLMPCIAGRTSNVSVDSDGNQMVLLESVLTPHSIAKEITHATFNGERVEIAIKD